MIDTKTPIDADASTSEAETEQRTGTDHAQDLVPRPEVGDNTKAPRQLSVSLRGFIVGLIIVVLAAAAAVFGWLYADATSQLNARDLATNNRTHAEEIASNYAVHAAEMDYQDFNGWKLKLVNGTSPELKDKLTKAADSMQQILAPLQWKSSARPLAAKVRSDNGGIYVVDTFVSVLTKTMQAPDGLQSTATYSVTLDSKNNWQITDVGGIDAALGK